MHRSNTIYKWTQTKTVIDKYVNWFWCERTTADIIFHWSKRYNALWAGILARMDSLKLIKFKVKLVFFYLFFLSCSFLIHKMLIDGLELCGLLVDYCVVFISSLDSHSDGTHSMQSINWWESDVMPHFSKSFVIKKQTHLHLDGLRMSQFSANFHFLGELFL